MKSQDKEEGTYKVKELFEIGFFMCLFHFGGNIWLSLIEWIFILIGFLIQYILLKKAQTLIVKVAFHILFLAGLIVGECMVWAVTGWERFSVVLLYGFGICCMLGVILAWLAYKIPLWIQKGRGNL